MADLVDERPEECLTLSVPEAGWKYYRFGKNGSYAAAQRGDIPTIQVGRRLRVPIKAMDRKLEQTADVMGA